MLRSKLEEFGFSPEQIKSLVKGKEVKTLFGYAKLDAAKENVIVTYGSKDGKQEVVNL